MTDHEDSTRVGIKGQYTNYFKVGFNAFEFVIDFGQYYEDQEKPQFGTRMVTSPQYAKELVKILIDSIESFERTHRIISDEEI